MSEWHPPEFELAQASETEADEELVRHLNWCWRCRGIAADYSWLDNQIPAALNQRLKEVPVPRPRWARVCERLRPYHHPIERSQLLAIAGAVLIACVMLVAPSALSREAHAEEDLVPYAVTVRVPASVDDQGDGTGAWPWSTSTPDSSISSHGQPVSLPFVPPPEPPEV